MLNPLFAFCNAKFLDNQTVPANYAPAKQPSPSAALKRKASTSPVEAKKPRLEKQSSVIAARQNVQSTEQLVASLGMEGILDSFARKEVNLHKICH